MRILEILEPIGRFTQMIPLSSLRIKKKKKICNRKETYQNANIDYLWVARLRMIFILFLIFSVFSKFPTINLNDQKGYL